MENQSNLEKNDFSIIIYSTHTDSLTIHIFVCVYVCVSMHVDSDMIKLDLEL